MQCPFCKTMDSKVIDSRVVGSGLQIRRRRECIHCEQRFTTYENVEQSFPRLIKKDGSFVQFEEAKLRTGISRALEKRPISSDEIDQLIQRIMNRLQETVEREISTQTLGEWVMMELRAMDEVAYVRFASVYRRFQAVEEFTQEVLRLREPSHWTPTLTETES